MINDVSALAEIRKNWGGVEALKGKLHLSSMVSGSFGNDSNFPFDLADAAQNLPFIHAFSILNDTLSILEDENVFKLKKQYRFKPMEALMKASQSSLTWNNYNKIDKGREDRNKLAHHGKTLNRGECWEYIDAIKAELIAWKIILP